MDQKTMATVLATNTMFRHSTTTDRQCVVRICYAIAMSPARMREAVKDRRTRNASVHSTTMRRRISMDLGRTLADFHHDAEAHHRMDLVLTVRLTQSLCLDRVKEVLTDFRSDRVRSDRMGEGHLDQKDVAIAPLLPRQVPNRMSVVPRTDTIDSVHHIIADSRNHRLITVASRSLRRSYASDVRGCRSAASVATSHHRPTSHVDLLSDAFLRSLARGVPSTAEDFRCHRRRLLDGCPHHHLLPGTGHSVRVQSAITDMHSSSDSFMAQHAQGKTACLCMPMNALSRLASKTVASVAADRTSRTSRRAHARTYVN